MNMLFKGWRSEIEIINSSVVIRQKPDMADHTIPFSQIVSTIIKKPGLMSNGLIFIQTVGSKGTSATMSKLDYASDKNSVFFSREMYDEALAFKKHLDELLAAPATTASEATSYSQLTELKNLLDQGIITQEDFDLKKKQILGL